MIWSHFRPNKCELLWKVRFFYPELDPANSNLHCGQMDSDFPYGGSTVTETVNKQDFKLDLIENLT